jgi:hypothetical protein
MKRVFKIILLIGACAGVAMAAQQGISLNSPASFPLDI